ncbi:hypothetical protein C1646_766693 [Rhizophagus diaphanus]|nr:hypothetical protein C1646_766693 [Rhizophagus diaphanus] [Rhizophagus sp. MUCL 43196]
MKTNGTPSGDQSLDPTPTFTIERQNFQAVVAPNAAPESLKKFPTNKKLINVVNNHFLETYESYTGKARMTGLGDAKCLIIHFQTHYSYPTPSNTKDIDLAALTQELGAKASTLHEPNWLMSWLKLLS